jgi:N-acyl-D-aspartate/D-glutamate deacylase
VHDVVIAGGKVVDCTGAPARTADVAVSGGRVAEVGRDLGPARRTIDAGGCLVAPGFVDIHTHYDVQAFWDPTLSPSPLHGVTTVVGGNCGFSIAPLEPADGEYLMRMLARVEGMPLEALERGAPWDWRSFAEYLDRIDGTLAPNIGFLVGHSALRRAVMHDDAVGRAASAGEVDAMAALLHEGLAAGGLGFSSTWSRTHNDHLGDPVPSRHASLDELLALCGAVGEHPGTTLEFIPGVAPFADEAVATMAAMSRAADRPLNWNVLQVYGANAATVDHQLAASDYAADHGGRVLALTLPDSFRLWLNLRSGFILDLLPGWDRLMALPDHEKLAMLADPAGRAEMDRLAQSAEGPTRSLAHWAAYRVAESPSDADGAVVGRTIGELAAERGRSPWDTLADLVVADGLRTVIANPDRGQDEASWAKRAEVWRDPRAVVGASDAGAHLDMIDSFAYCTTMLAEGVRKRGLLGWEEAIRLLTDRPARLYGLRDRGRVTPGGHADLVVLDPATVGPGPVHTRYDLPGGAGRIYGGAVGIEHVLVAGEEVVSGGASTDARPGRVLRSGADTDTVTAR